MTLCWRNSTTSTASTLTTSSPNQIQRRHLVSCTLLVLSSTRTMAFWRRTETLSLPTSLTSCTWASPASYRGFSVERKPWWTPKHFSTFCPFLSSSFSLSLSLFLSLSLSLSLSLFPLSHPSANMFACLLVSSSVYWHKKEGSHSWTAVQEVSGCTHEDSGSMPAILCALYQAQWGEGRTGQPL